jgi:DNA-binding HxlR family transcriptional regulator
MKWDALEEETCSIARTVAVIGDRWSLMILRECFMRIRRFEAFQSSLGITRHLLAERLKKLVRFGVLRRVPYQDSPKRYEYILTQKGLDLYPVIMSIVHWGDIHMVDARGRPMLYEHKSCAMMFDPVLVCSECNKPLLAKEVHVHPGPGADQKLHASTNRHAQVHADPAPEQRLRPSSKTNKIAKGRTRRVA